jgi:hypothetical protein
MFVRRAVEGDQILKSLISNVFIRLNNNEILDSTLK